MNDFHTYKVAIFDCDGVILNSNRIKSDAFAMALSSEEKNLVNDFIIYHQKNGGVSRYIKFEYFFKTIKKCSNYKLDLDIALKCYAKLSKKGLLECEEVPGVRQILKYFNDNNIPCFVASGGDQNEVISVLKERKLFSYFKDVYGSPLSKIENLGIIDSKNKLHTPGVYFGDARSDMLASDEFNLKFIFISGCSEWKEGLKFCDDNNISNYDDFEMLMES
jgi:phosphoglycolate phosphatase-like HAD superfamily hydrolase